ncbi:protein-glutamate methylesterase/protein-glutamine glutaminase [Ornithinibacillus bavariensis]|uniref:Protein-glutamate methylesterase/protein-glutamine glutaminase n=1 Tax=Ornithinibacillus bavariensis TaxID=545502 RepID=A0A920C4W5_9BACI|nr:chemotaxis response regulator protein-glutamate methylesterase [Ornithinibacillus bavariensis]GIO26171.1 chemotaxis response regulator protein-glutamate methylesterase [Ornithinibacillus bavariensis]HAM79411.1 chemotaxis response regulator protein-glutamate methylesterase [Ornithinibacillus sp.]
MTPIRVIVIDDSAFMRKMITDILDSDKRIQVIATARNGEEGIKKIKLLAPDVVTLDVEMPIMDGLTALSFIMKEHPIPVVMLSSLTKEGTKNTLQAITTGAVDFIQKPSGSISLDIATIKQEIVKKVVAAANVDVTRNQAQIESPDPVAKSNKQRYSRSMVLVGSSTGGPRALQRVILDLPEDFTAPVLIVQHMPAGFTKSLAERLNNLSHLHIKEASHGEIVADRTVYIAPGGFHMKLRKVGTATAIELTQEEERFGHRPSVDVLLESAAEIEKVNKIVVILTGMGSDGSRGIISLKQKDPEIVVLAESEDSAIIYGMPKAAVKTNAVNHIVHLHQMGNMIHALTDKSGGM